MKRDKPMSHSSKRKKRRQVTMAFLILLIIAFSVWVYWSNTAIQTTQIRISCEGIPEPFNGFKIVHVSDLHNQEFGNKQSKLLRAVAAAAPDLIAVTGDLIDARRTDTGKAMDFIHGAVKIAPVYYVAGNHEAKTSEYAKLEAMMTAAGVVILKDEDTIIERGGDSLWLAGLNDPSFTIKSGVLRENAALLNTRLKSMLRENSAYTILLSHRPELFHVYAANNINLVLSGHAHGGQVRLPFVGGIVAPHQGFFPRYDAGVHEINQTEMVVSRGLGNSIFPVRINNRPELVVITFSS